jgi:hypothetical protein
MALDPSITTTAANAAADAVVDLLDAGDSAAQLRIYDGTPPANAGAALSSNTLLASLTMSDPAFGAASNAVATASAISSDTSADATGTATFFRLGSVNSGTFTAVVQGNVGTSGADLNLSSVSITAGGTVAVSALTYTQSGTA